MPERPAIIEELVAARHAWGLSCADLAELMCCSESAVEKLECGHRHPSFRVLIKWADAMGYDLALRQRK